METIDHRCLDNPTWHALVTRQEALAQGAGLARRYHPDVAPFAALKNTTQAAFDDLAALIPQGEHVLMQTIAPLPPLDRIHSDRLFSFFQMVDVGDARDSDDEHVVRLGTDDVTDMVALAQKTHPGPFSKRTIETGHYLGIRDNRELIAMAGERMRLDGYVEISAVCVDERYRGKGLAGHLMNLLRTQIKARGEVPFLHVKDDNVSAIALYERLGFRTRQTFALHRVTLRQVPSGITSPSM